jgi:hypothetical protein
MSEQTYSKSGSDVALVKAFVEAKFKAALDKALAKPRPEVTTPEGQWFLWAEGVRLLPQAGNPTDPEKMVKVGDTFYVSTIVWFSSLGSPSPCNVITNLAASIDITYSTANLDTWQKGPAQMNVTNPVSIVPGQCYYVDTLQLVAQAGWEACYEMNISARLKGAQAGQKPPYAGFATRVYDFDPDKYPWFWPWLSVGPDPRREYDIPLRFMIYP